jgi:transposase-like protein
LSFRDVEELLAERRIDVSYETVRRWVTAFGPRYARRLCSTRPMPSSTWHLDEMFVSIGGRKMYLKGRLTLMPAVFLLVFGG